MIPFYYEFLNSVKILSGEKALENIAYELHLANAKKPLILSDLMLEKIGTVKTVLDTIKGELDLSVIFTDIPADSSIKVVNKIYELFKEKSCDSIIAIGGGSVIDTAKGVKMVASQEVDDIMLLMGSEIIKKGKKVPFIVVPTTAGTGSEATLVAVIANPDKGIKMEFLSYEVLPDVAVLDTRMTETLPPKATASTGMDALCHAIEAYSCLQKNPMSDAYAISAIRLVGEYLDTAVKDGKNKKARLAMANASLMAGVAFSNSMVGLVHAIGHAAGGVSHIPHGDAMTILLPYVMEFNMEKCREYYEDVLIYLGGAEQYACIEKSKRAEKAIEIIRAKIEDYNKFCKLPSKLRDTAVKEEHLQQIADKAINDGAIIVNPVKATSNDILGILKKAW